MAAVHRAGLALLAGDTDGTDRATRTAVLELAGADDQLQRGAAAALLGLAHWSRRRPRRRHAALRRVGRLLRGRRLPPRRHGLLARPRRHPAHPRAASATPSAPSSLRSDTRAEHPGLRGAADMHVGPERCSPSNTTTSTPPPGTCGRARSSASTWACRSTPTAGGSQRRGSTKPGATSTRRSTCSTEAEARYNTDFSPSVRPVAAHRRPGSQVERGDLDAGARWAAGPRARRRRRAQLRPRVRARHPRPASSSPEGRRRCASSRRSGCCAGCSPPPTTGSATGSAIEILVLLALAHQAAATTPARDRCAERSAGPGRAGGLRPDVPRRRPDCDGPAPLARRHERRTRRPDPGIRPSPTVRHRPVRPTPTS